MSGKPPIWKRWWFILLIVFVGSFIGLTVFVNLSAYYHEQARRAQHIFYEKVYAEPGVIHRYYWFFRVEEPTHVIAYMGGGMETFWLYRLGPETPRESGLAPIEYEERGAELILWNRGSFDGKLLDLEPGDYLIIVYTDKNAPWEYRFTVGLKKA